MTTDHVFNSHLRPGLSKALLELCREYHNTPETILEAYSAALADIAVAERQQLAHHLEMTEGIGRLV